MKRNRPAAIPSGIIVDRQNGLPGWATANRPLVGLLVPLAVKSSENCSVDSLQACYDDQSIHVTLPRLKHKMLGTEFVEFSNAE